MIGVISKESEISIVEEFFQLFKTPWEFYQNDRSYDIVLSSADYFTEINAKCLLIFSSERTRFDSEFSINNKEQINEAVLKWKDELLPVYGKQLTFFENENSILKIDGNDGIAGIEISEKDKKIIRIGFDLFQEIQFLLSIGQPTKYADIPTLDLHIEIIRHWIVSSGNFLIEIPPIPEGYEYIACLTHDVDFVGIRYHKFDRTMFGFIYRAVIDSLIGFIKGLVTWKKLIENCKAVLLLPFVYLGITKDFFNQFDTYTKIEKGLGSTFFISPIKNNDGNDSADRSSKYRAMKYDINDILPEIQKLISCGCEIGLHGIDAWQDVSKGQEEKQRIITKTYQSEIGIRMHWLFLGARSYELLDEAGFSYDSTVGYNDAVGFRAGTVQVFQPLGVKNMMELPMHIQDSAIFYSGRMGLTEESAFLLVNEILTNNLKYGGVLTINWHQRSLAPERLWKDFYIKLIDEIKQKRVWFGLANEVVSWFQKRRKFIFEGVQKKKGKIKIKYENSWKNIGPPLIMRIYNSPLKANEQSRFSNKKYCFKDIIVTDSDEIEIKI